MLDKAKELSMIERIEQYGFIEVQDYAAFSDSGNNPRGGRTVKEYAITLDMAKELSMVERNEQYGFALGRDFTVHKFMNGCASQTNEYM